MATLASRARRRELRRQQMRGMLSHHEQWQQVVNKKNSIQTAQRQRQKQQE
jgi:hypothetical protein